MLHFQFFQHDSYMPSPNHYEFCVFIYSFVSLDPAPPNKFELHTLPVFFFIDEEHIP